ncbi:MAG: recombinase family protein [Clostridiales bacterium]|nr:recombinase family protein [Clostridiales bacterium]
MEKPHVAIYVRKSKIVDTGQTVEAQILLCKKAAKEKYPQDTIEFYMDQENCGYYAKRPAFQRLIEGIRDGKVKAVYCAKLDRISRRTTDLFHLAEFLSHANVPLFSCMEMIDTSGRNGKTFLSLLNAINTFEHDTIGERISDNMYDLAREGRWLGGICPTGYRSEKLACKENTKKACCILTLYPPEARVVQALFHRFLETNHIPDLIEYADQQSFVSRNGKPFTFQSIKNILTNPVYASCDEKAYAYFSNNFSLCSEYQEFTGKTGLMVYNKTSQFRKCCYDLEITSLEYVHKNQKKQQSNWIVAVGKHEPLISGSDWVDIQKCLHKR